jgi:hypothetical protein
MAQEKQDPWLWARNNLQLPPGEFGKRIRDLFDRAERLARRAADGWGYQKVWRKAHTIPRHQVRGHWALVAVKNPRAQRRRKKRK